MDLNEIYTELIMQHNMSKHNKRDMTDHDKCEMGHNPSCGDEISLQIKFDGDVISDLSYNGKGCAISQASASMMIDLIKGKTREEAQILIKTFLKMITRENENEEELMTLQDAMVFQNIKNMPSRVKCAVLAWHTLQLLID